MCSEAQNLLEVKSCTILGLVGSNQSLSYPVLLNSWVILLVLVPCPLPPCLMQAYVLFNSEEGPGLYTDLVDISVGNLTIIFNCFCLTNSFCCCLVAMLCPTLCNSVDCSMAGSSVLCYLVEFAQIHVY